MATPDVNTPTREAVLTIVNRPRVEDSAGPTLEWLHSCSLGELKKGTLSLCSRRE